MPKACDAVMITSLLAAIGLAATAAPGSAAQLVSTHKDWISFLHEADGEKLCFITSEPKDKQPANARRDPVHFYISTWTKAGVTAEVSIKLGFPVKKGTDVLLRIEGQQWRLFGEGERAFMANAGDELKLIEAMRKGTRLTVEATSERGTKVVDTYSLAGLAQGLQALADACR
jgi:invasion protein IalB